MPSCHSGSWGQPRAVGDHAQPHGPRVLHGDVAESADAGDRPPTVRPGVGHLEALVDSDAGAQDGRYFQRVDGVRDSWGVGGVDHHVAAEAAVDAVAAVLLALTQRLPAGAAVFAAAARRPQPRVADLVTDLEVVHTGTECDDGAVTLVAGDERGLRLDRPIAVCGMQIGVAHAGGFQLHQGFTVAGGGQFEFGNLQRGAEFGDHRGTHGMGRGVPCGGRIKGV